MDLVVDANVIFASMIKSSVTQHMIFVNDFHLFTPEFVFEEVEKYKDLILKKGKLADSGYQSLKNILFTHIDVIPMDELEPFLDRAEEISPDPKDVPYLALALKIDGSLWSNDKALKKQAKIKVYSTSDLLKHLQESLFKSS